MRRRSLFITSLLTLVVLAASTITIVVSHLNAVHATTGTAIDTTATTATITPRTTTATKAATTPRTIATTTATTTPRSRRGQRVAIPSYFYPGSLWTQLDNAAPAVGLAIINPDSGPGTNKDQNYANQVTNTEAAGITVVGYVSTSYAGTRNPARTLAVAERDVNMYYGWYPNIGGIFVDEVSTDCNALNSYYQPLYDYIKNKDIVARVVLNPGTDTSQCYASAGDIIVDFEDTYSNYVHWTPLSWETKYPASRFWQIIYSTSATNMSNARALSKKRNAGWVYVTNDGGNNPYDTLPSYWSNELSQASAA